MSALQAAVIGGACDCVSCHSATNVPVYDTTYLLLAARAAACALPCLANYIYAISSSGIIQSLTIIRRHRERVSCAVYVAVEARLYIDTCSALLPSSSPHAGIGGASKRNCRYNNCRSRCQVTTLLA